MTAVGSERPAQSQIPVETGGHTLTLEPLRTLGPDSLDTRGIELIAKITLREIQVTWDNEFHQTTTTEADDIFNCVTADGVPYDLIPRYGKLSRAVFDIQFADSPEAQTIEIRPPRTIILPPDCDVRVIERWLLQQGFTSRNIKVPERTGSSNAQPVAMP